MSFPKRPKVAVLCLCGVPRRHRLAMATGCSGSLEGCLRGKEAAGFDFGEAFFQGEKLGNFPPLSSVAEVGQVEPLVVGVLKSGELRLEEG